MEYQFNKYNKIALFHDLDQSDEVETRMLCTLYAPVINLKYNCGIIITEEEIKSIAKKQIALWLLDPKEWWKSKDWIKAIYDYVKENAEKRGWDIPNLAITKTDSELDIWIELWYAVIIWIKVNGWFYLDAKDDWKLNNFNDYIEYKWTLAHFTNIIRWNGRNTPSEDNWKEYVLDSFFHLLWATYECNIKEILEDLDMTTKFIFF